MATVVASLAVDFDQLDVSALAGAPILSSSPTSVTFGDSFIAVTFTGSFTYKHGDLNGGVVTGYKEAVNGQVGVEFTGVNVAVPSLLQWAATGDNLAVRNAFLGGNDLIQGSSQGDFMRGYGGDDTIYGGLGDDTLEGGPGRNYLRGEDGADLIYGGSGFDDLNGNKGNDRVVGGDGDDWVLGGQDNDNLYGQEGNDLVYGNMGSDRLQGEAGADTMRGGQNNDEIDGGAGDDWLSGDRGDDILIGGAGADIFHTFGDNNHDSVRDFNRAEGDRVLLDPGTTYTVQDQGENVVITMAPGHSMVLIGVSMASLTGDWIVTGWS